MMAWLTPPPQNMPRRLYQMNKGDLVYVPSSAMLYYPDGHGGVKKYIKLNEPTSLLVTSVRDQTYEVFYEGEKWLVHKDKTYEVL